MFTSEHTSKDQKIAVKKTIDQINKLQKSLENLKLAQMRVKSTSYRLYPEKEWVKDRYKNKGFKAMLSLEVTTSEISRLGETMALASDLGLQNIGNLETFISPKLYQETYLKCLDVAALDAKEKALQLGKKLNFKVKDVLSLIEFPQQLSGNQEKMISMVSMRKNPSAQIESGEILFHTNIQVTFGIQ